VSKAFLLALLLLLPGLATAQLAEWDKTVQAAVKEGQLSLWGPPGAWARRALAEACEKRFPQIKVDYQGDTGAKGWPKIITERQAGIFSVDVHVGGASAVTSGYRAKLLQPIEPAFVLPELKDKKAWWRGQYHFGDPEGKYVFIFCLNSNVALWYNTKVMNPQELQSYRDLLDTKWKGKIVMFDPRITGPGNARWHFYVEVMGKEFARGLAKQIVLSRDHRQTSEWIATGKYPLGTGVSDAHIREFEKRGAPVKEIAALAEGTYLTQSWGTANLLDRPPHPNAAKLYLNWLLSKEGQLAWQREGYNSARVDIPKDIVDSSNLIVEGVKYQEQYLADNIERRDAVSTKLAQEFIKD
jgi:iron(III) transport system substrate-binding protein